MIMTTTAKRNLIICHFIEFQMYYTIKKKNLVMIKSILIVLFFIMGSYESMAFMPEKTVSGSHILAATVHPDKLLSPDRSNTMMENDTVNPNEIYHSEPAPMGLADFGVENTNGNIQAYKYNTTSFMGSVHINSLNVVNNTTDNRNMTFQFNVNLQFYDGTNLYVYWVQDVAYVNTSSHQIAFIDNIWNLSSNIASMHNSTVQGNGTIGNSSGTYYYYSCANYTLPGNYINLKYPSNVYFTVNSSLTRNGQPEVNFMYNDGYGWITYDNPVFTFVSNLTKDCGFVVDGYNYEPDGYSLYDVELILGGPGNGSCTADTASNITLGIQYWNGHNYQEIRSAYNFGADTAETIRNVVSGAYAYLSNGTIIEMITPGPGALACVYNSSDISTLQVTMNLPSGTLDINGTPHEFVDNEINLTVNPGVYKITIYNGSTLYSEFTVTLKAGEYRQIRLNQSIVTFVEKGLRQGTEWWVNLSHYHYSSFNSSISFYEYNGTYSYIIATSDHLYYPISPSGSFKVTGKFLSISINFSELTYNTTFIEKGLPKGTPWGLTLNGTTYLLTNNSYSFHLTNGTYDYMVVTSDKIYIPSVQAAQITVNGNISEIPITFTEVQYNLTFTETGLKSGMMWTLAFDNQSYTLFNTSYVFHLKNGTYAYSAASTGYRNISGYVTMNGASKFYDISFILLEYNVTFTETGLSSGTLWSVILNSTTESSTTSTIVFSEFNGTYSYTIASVSGYTVYASSGNITLNGKNIAQSVTFIRNSSKSTPFKLSIFELYAMIGAVVVIAAIGGAAIALRKRR